MKLGQHEVSSLGSLGVLLISLAVQNASTSKHFKLNQNKTFSITKPTVRFKLWQGDIVPCKGLSSRQVLLSAMESDWATHWKVQRYLNPRGPSSQKSHGRWLRSYWMHNSNSNLMFSWFLMYPKHKSILRRILLSDGGRRSWDLQKKYFLRNLEITTSW